MSDLYVTLTKADTREGGLKGERRYPLMRTSYSVLAHQQDCGHGDFSGGNEVTRLSARVIDGHYVIEAENVLAQFRIKSVRVIDTSDLRKASRRMHQEAVRQGRETAESLGESFKDLSGLKEKRNPRYILLR